MQTETGIIVSLSALKLAKAFAMLISINCYRLAAMLMLVFFLVLPDTGKRSSILIKSPAYRFYHSALWISISIFYAKCMSLNLILTIACSIYS